MRAYRLPASLLSFIYGLLAIMTLGGLAMLARGVGSSAGGPPIWFVLVWLGLMACVWYVYLKIPYKIKLLDDGSLEFHSLLRQLTLHPRDISAIRGVLLSPGFIRIRHTEGTALLLGQMTGLHELIAHIREANPEATVSGC